METARKFIIAFLCAVLCSVAFVQITHKRASFAHADTDRSSATMASRVAYRPPPDRAPPSHIETPAVKPEQVVDAKLAVYVLLHNTRSE